MGSRVREPHPMRGRRARGLRGRRWLLGAALLVAACDPAPAPEPGADPPPPAAAAARNVLLITIDTMRADALGAQGRDYPVTPNLDRMAADGVRFDQASSSAPLTLPSHASIMTGLHPFAHGARSNSGYVLPAGNVTLAERLAEVGFDTAAETSAAVIGHRTQLDQGFHRYRDVDSLDVQLKTVRALSEGPDGEVQELVERQGHDVSRRGIEFLRTPRTRPFFLWLHYFDPHVVYAPPEPFRSRFPDDPYYGEIAYTDAQVGAVISTLLELGLDTSTLVIVTSDHGEGRGEHDEETHAYFVYDSTIRVPLVLWGPPELRVGRRVETPVRTVDIAPTVLDWLGLPPIEGAHGRSLLPLAEGAEAEPRVAYAESSEGLGTFGTSVLRFVREGPWKYIHKVRPELYDLAADPHELENRAPEQPARVDALRGALRALVAAGPTPPEDAHVRLDEETVAQLAALGYAAASTAPKVGDELDSLAVEGVDPSDTAEDISFYARAWAVKRRDPEAAIAMFDSLLERYPESLPILQGRLDSLIKAERQDEAEPVLRRILALDPENARARIRLAMLLAKQGEHGESELLLRAAMQREPCLLEPRVRLASLLASLQRDAERVAVLREGIEGCDAPAALRNDYAYALATAHDPEVRDGEEALRIARQVAADGDPVYLDTLSAAYAETGDFPQAVATSRRALEIVRAGRAPDELVEAFQAHLETVEQGRPIRDP